MGFDHTVAFQRLAGATRRGHTTAPGGQTPAQCPDRGQPHSDMDVQPLENTALSWGTIRKSACILAEITYRKSQDCSVPGAATGRPGLALGSTTAGVQQRGGAAGAAPSAFGAPLATPVGHGGLFPGRQAGPGPQGGFFPLWTTHCSRRSLVNWSQKPSNP